MASVQIRKVVPLVRNTLHCGKLLAGMDFRLPCPCSASSTSRINSRVRSNYWRTATDCRAFFPTPWGFMWTGWVTWEGCRHRTVDWATGGSMPHGIIITLHRYETTISAHFFLIMSSWSGPTREHFLGGSWFIRIHSHWLIDWLIDRLIDWVINWLIDGVQIFHFTIYIYCFIVFFKF